MHEARQGVPLKPAALPLSHPRPVRTPQHDSSPPLHSFLYSVFFPSWMLLASVSLSLLVSHYVSTSVYGAGSPSTRITMTHSPPRFVVLRQLARFLGTLNHV